MERQLGILLAVMAITFLYRHSTDYRRPRFNCIALVTVLMTFFSGFRSWWMGDLIKYYTLFVKCNGAEWMDVVFEDYVNVGIRLFFHVTGSLGFSYEVCIFVIAAFSAVTLGMVVSRYSPSPYWSYLMYISMGFYFFTYSGLKQTIAMGFVLLAFICIVENKPIKFLLWVFLGTLFHAPAIVFIAAYPIAKKKINVSYFFLLIGIMLAVYFFKNDIVELLIDVYYETEKTYTVTESIGGRTIMIVFILVAAAILRPPYAGDEIYRNTFSLMIVAALIQQFSIYDNVFTRLADYYFQLVALFVPLMLESGQHQLARGAHRYQVRCYDRSLYTLLAIFVTLFALWFYVRWMSVSPYTAEYRFFWEVDEYMLYGR